MFIQAIQNVCELNVSAQDIAFMQRALALAELAEQNGEIPVGAIVVALDGTIIGEGWNSVIYLNDPTAHAENLAIRQAGNQLNNYRLNECTLYVTLEPCPMCAGAILHSRIKRVVFGAMDYKTGAIGSRFHLFEDYKMNHLPLVLGGVLKQECSDKISRFFQRRRAEKKTMKSELRQQ